MRRFSREKKMRKRRLAEEWILFDSIYVLVTVIALFFFGLFEVGGRKLSRGRVRIRALFDQP